MSDIAILPQGTFTHINNGTMSKSWLDHCICSQNMHDRITNIFVDENYSGSDHFPLYINFDFQHSSKFVINNDFEEKINWKFNYSNLSTIFYALLWQRLNYDSQHSVCTCRGGCQNDAHHRYLESLWSRFIQTAQSVGREVFGTVKHKDKCIPGWNDFIKDCYT